MLDLEQGILTICKADNMIVKELKHCLSLRDVAVTTCDALSAFQQRSPKLAQPFLEVNLAGISAFNATGTLGPCHSLETF